MKENKKTKLMLLGLSGLAYTKEWNKVTKSKKHTQKGGSKKDGR